MFQKKRERRNNGNLMADINITPFTDVVLVLLIIFMLAAPLIAGGGIKVDLPAALTAKSEEELCTNVTIHADGSIFLNDRKVACADLERLLADQVRRNPGLMVKVNGDRKIGYDKIVEVLDATRAAGALRYVLNTEKDRGKEMRSPHADEAKKL